MKTCPSTFNQLYLHSAGGAYPCSFLQNNPAYMFGHIQNQTLKDIFFGVQAHAFRKEHLRLNSEMLCSENQKKHSCNYFHHRDYINFKAPELFRLDVMLDSFCNLQCIMCTNIYDDSGGFKDDFFWTQNDSTFAHLKEVEIVGGEPLISPYFFKLADKINSLNPSCKWGMTTNANYKISGKLIQTLTSLKVSNFAISLDSLSKSSFEKIRLKSDFELVMQNIAEYKKYFPTLYINTVVQMENIDEITKIYEFTKKNGFRFYPILLTNPVTHSVLNWPTEKLKHSMLELIKKNSDLKSQELLLLIKKAMSLSALQTDAEVKSVYLDHLLNFQEAIDV